jgi:hypothetical protein
VMWGVNLPSFSVYSGRIAERREPRPGDLVLTRITKLPALGTCQLLYQRHGIALAQLSNAAAQSGPILESSAP